MSTFTKLSINGEVREVAALYDGSGNDITQTYETIINVTEKETALSGRITSVQEALDALTVRVTTTEAFDSRINKNAQDIAGHTEDITALQDVDAGYRTELDSLTIKVSEATTVANSANSSLGNLSLSIMNNTNKLSTLEALINDEVQGIIALNAQADKNTGDIATISENLNKVQESVLGKANQSDINSLQEQLQSLLSRIEALENKDNIPEEEPEPEPDQEPDPEPEPEEA